MDGFTKIAKISEIKDGEIKKFIVNNEPVAVVNSEGVFFAVSDTCTHHQCSLSEGFVEGNLITCPCHGGQFEIKTGAVATPPPVEPVKSYEVKVANDDLWIKS